MPDRIIPLSSDTETTPSEEMRQAMAQAPVGDEQKGADPSVNALLERTCEILGKESALFLPSGVMCNAVALKTHTRPGDVVIAEHMTHIIRSEAGGAGICSGILLEPVVTPNGIFSADDVDQTLARISTAPVPYAPPARLLCFEQTHNFSGGTVWEYDQLQGAADRGRELGLATHMDGARLFNAVAATGVSAARFSACVDSVWVDFTKGLGAPLGAVLAGSREFIAEARRYKHAFGGAMRQAGIVAAGCLWALEHHLERIEQDHAHARLLSAGLGAIDGIGLLNPEPRTNIVFFDVSGLGLSPKRFTALLKDHGVEMSSIGGLVRAVTHLDVSRSDIHTALEAIQQLACRK
ncbi:MAG: threonine aldolase family protein [Desulfovibrionales bacterium]